MTGSKNLKDGKNVRQVTVTAENGSTKTYTLNIYRSAGGEEPDNPDESEGGIGEEEVKDIIVTIGEQEYVVQENYDESKLPKGFIMMSAKYQDKEIPVIKDENLKYTLALLENQSTGDKEWFFYDEEKDAFSASGKISTEEAIKFGGLLAGETKTEAEPVDDKNQKGFVFGSGRHYNRVGGNNHSSPSEHYEQKQEQKAEKQQNTEDITE